MGEIPAITENFSEIPVDAKAKARATKAVEQILRNLKGHAKSVANRKVFEARRRIGHCMHPNGCKKNTVLVDPLQEGNVCISTFLTDDKIKIRVVYCQDCARHEGAPEVEMFLTLGGGKFHSKDMILEHMPLSDPYYGPLARFFELGKDELLYVAPCKGRRRRRRLLAEHERAAGH